MDVLLGEEAVYVETRQAVETLSQVYSAEVTNTTHLPHTDQISTWALG